jgi:hypothetical protein
MKWLCPIQVFCLLFLLASGTMTCGSEIREDSGIRQFAGNIGRLPVQNIHPSPITWEAAATTAAHQILGSDFRKRLIAMGYQSPVEFALHVAIFPTQTDLIPWFSVSLQLSERLGLIGRYAYRTYAELVEHREFLHSVASIHPLDITTMPTASRYEIQNLDRGLQAYHALRSLFLAGQGEASLAVRITEDMASQESGFSEAAGAEESIQAAVIPTEAAFVWSVVPVIGEEADILDWITLEEALRQSRQGNLLSPVAMAYAELFDGLRSNQASETLRSLKTLLEIPVIHNLTQETEATQTSPFQFPSLIPGILAAGLCLVAFGLMPWVWKRSYRWVRVVEILLMSALALKAFWLLGSGLGAMAGWFWQAGAVVHVWGFCLWISQREKDLRLRLPGMVLTALPILLAWPRIEPEVVTWTLGYFPVLWLGALGGWILGSTMLPGVSFYFFLHKGMMLMESRKATKEQKKSRPFENLREDLVPLRWILTITLFTAGNGLLLLQMSHAHPSGWVFPIACLLACALASAFLLQLAWIRLLSRGVLFRGLLCVTIFSIALATAPLPVAEHWLPPRFLGPSLANIGYQWILLSVSTWVLVELLLWGWRVGLLWSHRSNKARSKRAPKTQNQRGSSPSRSR